MAVAARRLLGIIRVVSGQQFITSRVTTLARSYALLAREPVVGTHIVQQTETKIAGTPTKRLAKEPRKTDSHCIPWQLAQIYRCPGVPLFPDYSSVSAGQEASGKVVSNANDSAPLRQQREQLRSCAFGRSGAVPFKKLRSSRKPAITLVSLDSRQIQFIQHFCMVMQERASLNINFLLSGKRGRITESNCSRDLPVHETG